jgi:hypothetical protein
LVSLANSSRKGFWLCMAPYMGNRNLMRRDWTRLLIAGCISVVV